MIPHKTCFEFCIMLCNQNCFLFFFVLFNFHVPFDMYRHLAVENRTRCSACYCSISMECSTRLEPCYISRTHRKRYFLLVKLQLVCCFKFKILFYTFLVQSAKSFIINGSFLQTVHHAFMLIKVLKSKERCR